MNLNDNFFPKKNILLYFNFILTLIIQHNSIFAQNSNNLPAHSATKNSALKEIRTGGYKLINPLLDCYELKSSSNSTYKELEKDLSIYIKQTILSKKASTISVYFRDLNNGPWIGINEDENYAPASLLKVPFLMAALYQAQNDMSFLSQKVKFLYSRDIYNQNLIDGFQLKKGQYYTIDELLEAMIIHSDNEAKNLIMDNLSDESYYELFDELGIDIRKQDTASMSMDFLSVKDYASFFRILYNSTFLTKQMSEKALTILSKSTFDKGIVAGIKDPLFISHKFGERTFNNTNLRQLHDCGIVYKPQMPYIICVMTRGYDFEQLQKIIAEISKMIYNKL